MKFKMTCEQIKEVNELLQDFGDSLTVFYDEALYRGRVEGIVAGALVGVVAANICWVVKTIKKSQR